MSQSISQELKRKLLHITSVIIPISYIFISKPFMVIILLALAILTASLDTLRHYHKATKKLFSYLEYFMRRTELNGSFMPSGTRYMAAGFLIVTAIFSKGLAISSMLVLVFADAAAAIFGMYFTTFIAGENNGGKSIAGSVAFFLVAILVSTLGHNIVQYEASFSAIILASTVSTFIEYHSRFLKIDDNLSIPLSFAISVALCDRYF